MNKSISELESFYLEATAKCYVSGEIPLTTIAELPGWKVRIYSQNDLRYTEAHVSQGEKSRGMKTISTMDKPIWAMQFHGWCKDNDKYTLAFLKAVLKNAFGAGIWNGGRGPSSHMSDPDWPNLQYENEVLERKFDRFRGREEIYFRDISGHDLLFWHEYSGGLLIPLE